MSILGNKLRDARIEKGYTLNILQQMTKIQKKYLIAIEEGQFSELPGTFYVRAFVKQYADVVGLNGDELLEEHANELDLDIEENLVTIENIETETIGSRVKSRQQNDHKNQTEILLSYLPLVFLVVIILMIIASLVTALMRVNQSSSDNGNVQQVSTSIVSTVSPESAAVSTTVTESEADTTTDTELAENQLRIGDKVMRLVSSEGEETVYEIDATDFTGITFSAIGKSYVWVGMLEDDVMVVDTTVSENETFDYSVTNPAVSEFRIRLGYAEGATLTVNGTEIPLNNTYFPDTVVFRLKGGSTNTPAVNEESVSEETTEFEGPAVYQEQNGSDR